MAAFFDLQGHRGARGLKPENTLPSFEVAFDLGVTSVETDVHFTRDNIPVLVHDPWIDSRASTTRDKPRGRTLIAEMPLAELQRYRVDANPDPPRFPGQDNGVTPVAQLFAASHGFDPYSPPTLAGLFAFAEAYAGDLGAAVGKSETQRRRAYQVGFDIELKRVPFRPTLTDDGYPAPLEYRVVETVQAAGMADRTSVRSFDHRTVLALRRLAPDIPAAVLVADLAPVDPAALVRQANAQVYSPSFEFLDETQVRQLHAEGIRVLPWTVNEPADWARLLEWNVDGITTDYPDQLAALLRERGIDF